MRQADDSGPALERSLAPGRVVSLVPSLTEAIAVTRRHPLVGATDWCTHPADLEVVRVAGTKNPDLDAILSLEPDLVVANEEENRAEDLDALRASGLAVWVTDIRTVEQALDSLAQLMDALGTPEPAWLRRAHEAWADPPQVRAGPRVRAVVPIWRKPWMFVGRDTYAGDVLAQLGVDNVLADSPDRYPRTDLDDLPDHELAVLPDEPWEFGPDDGPEAFTAPTALVSGRLLTWYGPAMVDAPAGLAHQLRTALAAGRGPDPDDTGRSEP